MGAQQYSFFGGFDDGADAPLGGLEVGRPSVRVQETDCIVLCSLA